MSRFRATLTFTLLVAATLAPGVARGESNPALWRFVHPNPKALISIDWARIRQTQVGAVLREKWLNVAGQPMPAIPGLELLKDVDRILISSPGGSTASDDSAQPDDGAQQPLLIAIHGHFDPAEVRQVFTRFKAKPQAYNSFQVYRPQGKQAKDMAYVLFDNETILVGDAPSVFAALDRNQFAAATPPTPAPGSIAARAAEMESNYDFWLIMDAPEILANDSVASLLRGGEWASEAQGFEAGLNLRGGLVADITVRFSSDATAKRVTTELTRVLNAAAKDRGVEKQVQDIAKKLKFNVEGSATKISLRLSEPELEKAAQSMAASMQAGQRMAASAVSNRTPAPAPIPAPLKPAVIRIEGLDDGPREIPYPDRDH
jgi:hypothetical protein